MRNIILIIAIVAVLGLFGALAFSQFLMAPATHSEDATQWTDKLQSAMEGRSELTAEVASLKGRIAELSAANEILRKRTSRFEEEKSVILGQVRESVSGFSEYKEEVGSQIEKLSSQLAMHEKEKAELEMKLQSVSSEVEASNDILVSQIHELNTTIDDYKGEVVRLKDLLKKKEKTEIVVEAAKLHYNLGNFYFRQQQYESAAAEYRKAIIYQPNDADAHFNLALVCDEHLGFTEEAIKHYKRYLAINPDDKNYLKIENRILDLELREMTVSGNSLAS